MNIKSRLDKLARSTEARQSQLIILMPDNFENFTLAELDTLKAQHLATNPGKDIEFIIVRYVNDW